LRRIFSSIPGWFSISEKGEGKSEERPKSGEHPQTKTRACSVQAGKEAAL